MNDDIKVNEDYRRVLATANKLETIHSSLETVIDFFLTPIVKLQTKLCNDCLKLFFETDFKLDQFRKAEELVWRRIYHDLYRFQKTKRNEIKQQDEYLIESHFISGIGFYSSLIVKLRTKYKINDAFGILRPLALALGPLDDSIESRDSKKLLSGDNLPSPNVTDDGDGNEDSMCLTTTSTSDIEDLKHNQTKAQEWARQAIYRSLVYSGDLARYLLEISQHDYRKLAFDFYISASRNHPDHGLPYNQLATLAGGLNFNLDAVCNYMRCCLRPKPFEGAEGNMRKIFDLNRRFHEELNATGFVSKISDVYASKDPSYAAESMMRAVIINFIRLTSDLWLAISENNNPDLRNNIVNETKSFFEILRECLELEPIVPLASPSSFVQEFLPISGGSSFPMKPRYVTSTIMCEFCSVSIMLITKCQRQLQANKCREGDARKFPVIDEYIVDLVNTLALNLLHYSTSKCQKIIIGKIQELRFMHHDSLISGSKSNDRKGNSSSIKDSSDGNLIRNNYSAFLPIPAAHQLQPPAHNLISSTPDVSPNSNRRQRQKKAATNYSGGLAVGGNNSNSKAGTIGVIGIGNNNCLHHLAPHAEDSDMSELEETALSTIDALDISSSMSSDAGNDLINLDSSDGDLDDGAGNSLLRANNQDSAAGKPPRVLRPTKSQNYEFEKISLSASKQLGSSSSLPIPDLLTGDSGLQQHNRQLYQSFMSNIASSQSPLNSPGGSDVNLITSDTIGNTEIAKTPTIYNQSAFSQEKTRNAQKELESAWSFIYERTYLPTIKLFCDWLLANSSVISSNVQSFISFDSDLKDMVNLLQELEKTARVESPACPNSGLSLSNYSIDNDTTTSSNFSGSGDKDEETNSTITESILGTSKIFKHRFDGPSWIQKYPLSCDFPLMCLEPIKSVHDMNIHFKFPRELSNPEAGFITIQCISAFSHALTAFLANKAQS